MANRAPLNAQWFTENNTRALNSWILEQAQREYNYHSQQAKYWEDVLKTAQQVAPMGQSGLINQQQARPLQQAPQQQPIQQQQPPQQQQQQQRPAQQQYQPPPQQQQARPMQSVAAAPAKDTRRFCKAMYAYPGNKENNVYEMKEGELFVLLQSDGDWWLCQKTNSNEEPAYVPRNYVEVCDAPGSEQPKEEKVVRAKAKYDYLTPTDNSFLAFKAGDVLTIKSETQGENWWLAQDARGAQGYVPSNYMELLQ